METRIISLKACCVLIFLMMTGCYDWDSFRFDAGQDADIPTDSDTDFDDEGDTDIDADETDPDGDRDEETCESQDRLACNEDDDVIWLDSCGQPEEGIVEDCPNDNGFCLDGVCVCEEGWSGEDCDRCLVFVAESGDDGNTGISWEQALATVVAGLSLAEENDCDVWVAAGTYYPSDVPNRLATFQLVMGVGLFGGFAGTESTFDERNIEANLTILSGDIDRNGIRDDSNVYHVVTGIDDSILDGFTIAGGNANDSEIDESRARGGGMYNRRASPTVRNCIFSDNYASDGGGAMFNDISSPVVSDCIFSGNRTSGFGGGMFNRSFANPTITNCTFSDSSAEHGGGMSNHTSSSPIITNCTFSDNSAYNGGGMSNHTSSSPTITNCSLSDNSAYAGGGLYNASSSPTVTNCLFLGNRSSPGAGGGMSNITSFPTVTNGSFFANDASHNGGGIYNQESSPILMNTIVWGNTAGASGPQIHNNDKESVPSVKYSDIQGGHDGEGNIDSDPLVDGSFRLTEGSPCIDAGDSSVFIEGATDLDGNPRIVDGDENGSELVDMGAFEYDPIP